MLSQCDLQIFSLFSVNIFSSSKRCDHTFSMLCPSNFVSYSKRGDHTLFTVFTVFTVFIVLTLDKHISFESSRTHLSNNKM